MITSPDHYIVIKNTPANPIGTALFKLVIEGKVYYGTDKRNNFFTKEFLDEKKDLFEYRGLKTN